MKIAHISDSHFDASADLDDVVRTHTALVHQAREEGVDLIVHAGDWFDRASVPDEREALSEWLFQATGYFPVVGVKGNHDQRQDLAIFGKLRTMNPVLIHERPIACQFLTDHGTLLVLAVPWFDKAPLASRCGPGASQNDVRVATIDQARTMLAALAPEAEAAAAHGWPTILLGHVMVQAARVASGQMLVGQSVELSAEDLRLSGAGYCAIGHVHQHQAWTAPGQAPVVYSGSPTRHDHGEPETKGWVLVEFDGPRLVRWEFRQLPARELYHLDLDATDPEILQALRDRRVPGFEAALAAGARVRIRYKVAAEDLVSIDADVIRAIAADAGAHDVKVEHQAVAVTAARAEAVTVSGAGTLSDKVAAYLAAKGLTDRTERVLALLDEVSA